MRIELVSFVQPGGLGIVEVGYVTDPAPKYSGVVSGNLVRVRMVCPGLWYDGCEINIDKGWIRSRKTLEEDLKSTKPYPFPIT